MQRDLVIAARDGDLEAYSQLVRAAFPRLYGVASLILRDSDRAQDAVQDALVLAWRHVRSLRDPDAWDAWLRRLTVRACYTMDTGFWLGEVGDGSVIRGNRIPQGDIGLSHGGGGNVLIAENELASIEIEGQSGDGITIRDNVVRDAGYVTAGIILGTGAPLVEGNLVVGVPTGISVPEGGSPTISGNQLEELGVGIRLRGTETRAAIEGNRFCGNQLNVVDEGDASLPLDPSNEICEDDAA